MAKKKSTSGGSRKAKKSSKKAKKSSKAPSRRTASRGTKRSASAKKATSRKTPKRAKKSASRTKAKVPAKPKAAKASPLTKAQLRELRDLLLEKRRSLLGDMNGIQESNGGWQNGSAGSMPTHPADIGTDNYEHEFTLGLLESERALLEEIDEALERMEGGSYGICQGTGKPIGYPRLRARPWAKYCIDYARMIEKGLVHPGEDESEKP
ncbi:MAG: TraR/DksA C4-type zinc finger protein [Phycisphaerae bacterium]|nr:TraR/DksA C4-type zinc finger protein [Phycisphaerae bacterium]